MGREIARSRIEGLTRKELQVGQVRRMLKRVRVGWQAAKLVMIDVGIRKKNGMVGSLWREERHA